MEESPKWQTNRFRDCVAICIGTGETVYMTTKQARALSAGVNRICRSIERQEFADSRGLTTNGEGLDPNKHKPVLKRRCDGVAYKNQGDS